MKKLNYTFPEMQMNHFIFVSEEPSEKTNWIIRTSQSYHEIILKGIGNDKYVRYIPQFSTSLSINKQFSQKLIIKAQIGIDNGARNKNTIGLNIGVKYQLK
ncbi:hypothetical protein [Aquirufa ecclesiirivi]